VSQYFGEDTFHYKIMKERLPAATFKKLMETIHEDKKLDLKTADVIAEAMKKWALEKGATHFAHWFQPMTGITAEKHDAFIDPCGDGRVVENFPASSLFRENRMHRVFRQGGFAPHLKPAVTPPGICPLPLL